MTATSSSDRYEAARKALTEHGHRDATPGDPGSIAQLTVALRSLIEPPATVETPAELARRVYRGIHDFPALVDGDIMRDLITRGILAGIQAAWESWEPENSPGFESEDSASFMPGEGEMVGDSVYTSASLADDGTDANWTGALFRLTREEIGNLRNYTLTRR